MNAQSIQNSNVVSETLCFAVTMHRFDYQANLREACACSYVLLDDLLIVDSLPRGTTVQGRGVGVTRDSARGRLIASSLIEHGSVLFKVSVRTNIR